MRRSPRLRIERLGSPSWTDSFMRLTRRESPSGRMRMRRMTRRKFENTLVDLLALPRLDVQSLLPIDGRVAGYDKIADGLDLSPAHLAAYEEAIERRSIWRSPCAARRRPSFGAASIRPACLSSAEI